MRAATRSYTAEHARCNPQLHGAALALTRCCRGEALSQLESLSRTLTLALILPLTRTRCALLLALLATAATLAVGRYSLRLYRVSTSAALLLLLSAAEVRG